MNHLLAKYQTVAFPLEDLNQFKSKAFIWANQYACLCYLDSNEYETDQYHQFESLIGIGNQESIFSSPDHIDDFEQLKIFYEKRKDWMFGYFSYDLKNQTEKLVSENPDSLGLPEMHFFQPQMVIEVFKDHIHINSIEKTPEQIFQEINSIELPSEKVNKVLQASDVKAQISKERYLETIERIRQHIIEGDLYEMNFCQEFYIEDAMLNPVLLFQKLNQIAKAPFTAFYKNKHHYLLCASPERFIQKRGQQIISQPIKGTKKRGETKIVDEKLKIDLYNSEKDRSENVMIVDLVRNDLSKKCEAGSVKVEELFGIYSFEQVHHMISTISGTLKKEIHFMDLIKGAFPMGSMTGAPKVMSMELIEKYEASKRGLYSGAIGYITPNGDFDFNVVIRSMLYNALEKYLSFQVGGAIVYDSSPEDEYQETLLKAKGMLKALFD